LRYSRYADDLAFSGDGAFAKRAQRFEALVAAIALDEGFRINHHKTRVMLQSQAQHWLGLVINEQPAVSRTDREHLEAILTNAARHGLESQNREGDPHFLESLRGRVAWVEQVSPAHARKLIALLAACSSAPNKSRY
jgi:RNA-directed DNA polymerase